jgi:hypothetical protein
MVKLDMIQRFYQKATVQVAIVSGLFILLATGITIWHQRSELKRENKRLLNLSQNQTAEIQRLETLLTPFRTIAIEKFTGTEAEALQQLAERITTVDAALASAKEKIEGLQEELLQKTSDRSLTEEQKQSLKSSLAGVSGKVIVKADFADSEAQMFANQIKSTLADTDLELIEQASTGVVSIHEKGICILVNDIQNPPPHAVPILKAFQQISTNVVGRNSRSAKFPQDAVIVWVCHR